MPAPASRRRSRALARAGLLHIALLCAGSVSAHGGGLNADGCHTNRKTGEYHCHRAPAPVAAPHAYRPTPPAPTRLAPERMAPVPTAPGQRPYANCAEARAAGAAPVHRGDPGYGPHLDRDNDGVGCEPYRGR